MWSLAIETSGPVASIALADDREIVADDRFESRQTLSVHLLARLDKVLRDAGLLLRQVDRIAVGLGPGSFTGLRIGVTTARTLAHALGIRIVGCESPVALWHAAAQSLSLDRHTLLCAAVPSKRDEAYVLAMPITGQTLSASAAEYHLVPLGSLEDFVQAQGTSCVFVGAPARMALRSVKARVCVGPPELDYPTAEMVFRLAVQLPDAPLPQVRPRYVRRSQAETAVGEGPRPWTTVTKERAG